MTSPLYLHDQAYQHALQDVRPLLEEFIERTSDVLQDLEPIPEPGAELHDRIERMHRQLQAARALMLTFE